MAAQVGSQAFFNCTADADDDYVTWDYYDQAESAAPVRIYVSHEGQVKNDLQDKFGIERDDMNGIHGLVIKNVQFDLGVRYFCGLALDGMKEAADLVAVSMFRNFPASFRLGPREPGP